MRFTNLLRLTVTIGVQLEQPNGENNERRMGRDNKSVQIISNKYSEEAYL